DPAGVHRRAGGAVRILSQRRDPDGKSLPRSESQGLRRGDQAGTLGCAVPVLHAPADDESNHAIREVAMRLTGDARNALISAGLSRRRFLKRTGALVVGFSAAGVAGKLGIASSYALAQSARASDTQLDSWLAVGGDGIVTAYTGKCELGQGLQTAQIQLIAEELFVPVGRVRLV